MATTDARNRVAMENDGSRVDAVAKVTGAARYTFDVHRPNMIQAAFVRAPFAAAKLVSADLDAARKVKGVLEVVLYGERKPRGGDEEAASLDAVRPADYAGEAVGHVCAENLHALGDAIAALKMVWEHGEAKTNFRKEAGPVPDLSAEDAAKLDAIFGAAAHVVEATYDTQVQHHVSLESHCAVAELDGEKAIVWGSTQGTGSFRDGLEADLGIEKKDIEVRCEYVGGGFGSKFGPGIEGKLAARMAKKFGRPCRVANNRKDESRDTGMRPGSIQYYKLACDAEGKVLGGRHFARSSVGTRRGGGGVRPPGYGLGEFVSKHEEVNLNSCPPRPQRAPGWPQGAFALEGVLDELAAKAGVDPVEFRKKNDARPRRVPLYDLAAKEVGWERRKPDGAATGTLRRGFGIGAAEWHNEFFAPCGAEIRVYPDGKVEIRSGTQDIGTGNRTMLVDLAAHGLGLDRKFIAGLNGSTEYPPGPAAGGSVAARSIAPAVLHAAELAAADLLARAAAETGVAVGELAIRGDAVVLAADGTRKLGWTELCKTIGTDPLSFLGKAEPKFRGEGDSDGVCAAEVEVDVETGIVRLIKLAVVQQCGMPVNRKIAESQIVGGAIQGIGYTMFEDRILDASNGAPVNPNMEWYKLPGPADMPEIVPILDSPDDYTGVRSLGEPPIIGVPGAIAGAVANAIGARVRSLPITPAKVLAALQEKGGVA